MAAHTMTHAEPTVNAVNTHTSAPNSSVTIIGTTPKQIIATYRHMPLREKRCGQMPTKPLPARPPKPIATSTIPTQDDCMPRCFVTIMGAPIVSPTNARFKTAASKITAANDAFCNRYRIDSRKSFRHVVRVAQSPIVSDEAFCLSAPPNSRAEIANVTDAVAQRASIPKHP